MNSSEFVNYQQHGPSRPVWNSVPRYLDGSAEYQSTRDFILSGQNAFDFFFTITFIRKLHDDAAVKAVSHLLNIVNSKLTNQRFRQTGRYIEGFAFAERHIKSIEREGGLHFHILGKYSEAFHTKPSFDRLNQIVMQALPKVLFSHGRPMLHASTVDIREAYAEDGLVNYLSKHLTIRNLSNRVLFVGKDGITGNGPELRMETVNYGF